MEVTVSGRALAAIVERDAALSPVMRALARAKMDENPTPAYSTAKLDEVPTKKDLDAYYKIRAAEDQIASAQAQLSSWSAPHTVGFEAEKRPTSLNIATHRTEADESSIEWVTDDRHPDSSCVSAKETLTDVNEWEATMTREEVYHRDPDILDGTLVQHLTAGDSLDDFLNDFPTVRREQAEAWIRVHLGQ